MVRFEDRVLTEHLMLIMQHFDACDVVAAVANLFVAQRRECEILVIQELFASCLFDLFFFRRTDLSRGVQIGIHHGFCTRPRLRLTCNSWCFEYKPRLLTYLPSLRIE